MKKTLKCIVVFIMIISLCSCSLYTNIVTRNENPRIKSGEFECKLTYELNGEIIVIEDTIICEYTGTEMIGEAGFQRKYTSKLKSGKKELVMLDLQGQGVKDKFGREILYFYFYWGNAEYLMGDTEDGTERATQPFGEFVYKYDAGNDKEYEHILNAEYVYENFGLKIIDWECDSPLENSFNSR